MSASVTKRKLHNDDDDEDDSRPTKIVLPGHNNTDDKSIIVFILPDCIGPKRLGIMKKSVEKMGFTLTNRMRSNVTHVLSELETQEEVMKSKEFEKFKSWKGYMLESQWLAECVKCHSLVSETAFFLPSIPLPEKKADDDVLHKEVPLYPIPGFDLKKFNECIPERKAVLDHQNKEITEALDLLSDFWKICHQSKTDELRALAYARAAAAVRCLPFKVTNSQQLQGIKDLGGGHALRVATQIVESGHCPEVEEKRKDKKFLSLKIFCKVYGVGPSIAEKWYVQGLRTTEDVKKLDPNDISNDMVTQGVAFYDDLNRPLLLSEAENTYKYITDIAKHILPSVVTSMNGGFRRGKSSGHDLDVLFSYPERHDGDYGLIAAVLDELDKKGLVVWSRSVRTDGPRKVIDMDSSPLSSGSSKDNHLPTIMIIFKYPLDDRFDEFERRDYSVERNLGAFQLANLSRQWRAIRVDLVGSTESQYPYALVGWTGSKQYNRSLRKYAKECLNYSLSSTGLYDKYQNRWIAAQTEQDVFHHLKLTYHEPWERNF